ncbi:calcium-binding EGF-like domain-containing protein [Chitinophagaceae bacterium MMS25-I14]
MRRIFSKQILFVATLSVSVFCMVAYTACIKTNCGTTVCQNGGVCVSGICACPSGYEGAHCDKPWMTKFAGTWNNAEQIQDSSGLHNLSYHIAVRADTLATQLVIDSLEQTNNNIHCVLLSVNSFTIPGQSNADSTFYVTGGSGSLDSTGKVTMNYNFVQSGLPRTAQLIWTR